MSHNLYIGNLSYSVTNEELHDLFAKHGEVESAKVILDRETSRSRGFGFVEIGENTDINEVIDSLDGQDFQGRPLVVRKAREKNGRDRRPNHSGANKQEYRRGY